VRVDPSDMSKASGEDSEGAYFQGSYASVGIDTAPSDDQPTGSSIEKKNNI
jgi:hypothetical protein